MIILDIPNDYPFQRGTGLATKYKAPSITAPPPVVVSDFCYCKIECEYVEDVFHSDDSIWWKNDKSSFLFAKKKTSDTIAFELYKNKVKIADITDDTYGTMYDGFSVKPKYKGYLIDWKKVFEANGNGRYQFKANLDILGEVSVYESQKFSLSSFSQLAANKTVRVESYQTGNIIGSQFNFTELLPDGWYQSFRIKGFFGDKRPVLEKDDFVDVEYNIEQIQDKIISEFSLRTLCLPSSIANELFYSNMLANRIYITDYNIVNHEFYNQVDVTPIEPEEVTNQVRKTGVKHSWKFKLRVEDNIKTNY